MKRLLLLLTTSFLFLLTITVTAQVSPQDTDKAKTFIRQAQRYAAEQEYASVAQLLQQAYDINPKLFDCNSIQLLGVSYYMMENSPLAIKFLEQAVGCEPNRETLAQLYLYLSDSYHDMHNYKQAVANSLKSISHTTSDKAISVIYEEVANMHFDHIAGNNKEQDKIAANNAIDAMQKSVTHYLKHLSVTEDEVMRGNVKNAELAQKYFNLTWFASDLNIASVMRASVVKAALCGNADAIAFCKKNNIPYQAAIVLPSTSSKEDQAAQALLKQAVEQASKQQYTLAVSNFDQAYRLSPTIFSGKAFHLMGLSYFSLSKYTLAIKYLERALQFDFDKNALFFIHGTLADAYNKAKDYPNALKNAEKSLYLADTDQDVLTCSLRLASIYYAMDELNSTVDSFLHAIKYHMKINSITDAQVMRGDVKDKFLAENHLRVSRLLNDLMRSNESDVHLKKAALCGSDYAIEILKKNKVKINK